MVLWASHSENLSATIATNVFIKDLFPRANSFSHEHFRLNLELSLSLLLIMNVHSHNAYHYSIFSIKIS